jgi:hypothetical protein
LSWKLGANPPSSPTAVAKKSFSNIFIHAAFRYFIHLHPDYTSASWLCFGYLPSKPYFFLMTFFNVWYVSHPIFIASVKLSAPTISDKIRRLRAVPPFRGFRFPGKRKERRDCRQHINKWNTRCPHNAKFPLVEIDTPVKSNLIRSNYAINNFQTECWFYK